MVVKNKRYYWIQLAQDFFKSKEMKLLRKIEVAIRTLSSISK